MSPVAPPLRLGIVGAGSIARQRHLPNFQALDGVSVEAVCNRSRASGESVAEAHGIPRVRDHWRQITDDPELDAVVIGTWPYLHCPVTLAALAAGKHVLCQARMACDADEARRMQAAAAARPDLVTQVVPSPVTLAVDPAVQHHLAEGLLGELLAVDVQAADGSFVDRDSPLHWRQDISVSGLNTLGLGIWYEALLRWVGPATRVLAAGRTVERRRREPESGTLVSVEIPDHLDVLADLACGAQGRLQFSAVTGLAPTAGITLYGSEGTLRFTGGELYSGGRGDAELSPLPVPEALRGGWRVEEEFVAAIREGRPVRRTTFADGVRYMEFTEAVARSRQSGRAVALPLLDANR